MRVHLPHRHVTFVHEGHWIKVKVTEAKKYVFNDSLNCNLKQLSSASRQKLEADSPTPLAHTLLTQSPMNMYPSVSRDGQRTHNHTVSYHSR